MVVVPFALIITLTFKETRKWLRQCCDAGIPCAQTTVSWKPVNKWGQLLIFFQSTLPQVHISSAFSIVFPFYNVLECLFPPQNANGGKISRETYYWNGRGREMNGHDVIHNKTVWWSFLYSHPWSIITIIIFLILLHAIINMLKMEREVDHGAT